MPDKMFREVIINSFSPDPGGEIPELAAPGTSRLRRAVFRGSAESDYGNRLHATREQFRRAYPQAKEFFELKRKYDSEELFQNQFYEKYKF